MSKEKSKLAINGRQIPHTSTTVQQYRQMFMQFSLRVWASEYTCRPMIADLPPWGVVVLHFGVQDHHHPTHSPGGILVLDILPIQGETYSTRRFTQGTAEGRPSSGVYHVYTLYR